jgi:hypothetical protein
MAEELESSLHWTSHKDFPRTGIAHLPGTALNDVNAPQQLRLQLGTLVCEGQTLPQIEER